MISYIKGTVEFIGADFAVIECGSIGYKIRMPLTQLNQLPKIGLSAKVYTYMYVREDILDLYGFMSERALALFDQLISVSGVGPKAAISILSALEPDSFVAAVSGGDYKSISTAQGIGTKTAQRIVLELKDKLGKTPIGQEDIPIAVAGSNAVNEAISALISLGYSYNESKAAVAGAVGETTEELVKYALKMLMR
jgi:Holliday junction DNA helicase RuvA